MVEIDSFLEIGHPRTGLFSYAGRQGIVI